MTFKSIDQSIDLGKFVQRLQMRRRRRL